MAVLMIAALWWGWRPQGIEGRTEAVEAARGALRQLGYEAWGEPTVSLEADQALAWAVERSRPGWEGVRLARERSGAVRWRVRFAGGGEVVCSTSGRVWTARRPLPTFTGEDLLPVIAQEHLASALHWAVPDPDAWQGTRFQSWFEGGRAWHRAWYGGEAGALPGSWERELELELAGSTLMALQRRVKPRGVDLGVVSGRVAELNTLKRAGHVALAILAAGVLVAVAAAVAFYERLALFHSGVAALAVFMVGLLAGMAPTRAVGPALAVALVVAAAPTFSALPKKRIWRGAPVGVALALGVMSVRVLVVHWGGWMPLTGAVAVDPEPWRLAGQSWFPALLEEPLLRAALPGLLAPYLGWWGTAVVGAGIGSVLHPLPSVPLPASLLVEFVVHLGMAFAARIGGLPAAVMARGTYESLVRRSAYPAGAVWDYGAMVGVILGVGWLMWPRRK